jgi:hypothetical protein
MAAMTWIMEALRCGRVMETVDYGTPGDTGWCAGPAIFPTGGRRVQPLAEITEVRLRKSIAGISAGGRAFVRFVGGNCFQQQLNEPFAGDSRGLGRVVAGNSMP